MREMLDVVNEQDVIIGQQERSVVHRDELWHRATHILLKNSAGQLFVQLRSMSKDTNPGLWDTSAAGHVDAGEGYLACAIREVAEELGIELQAEELTEIGRMSPTADNGYEFVRIYGASSDAAITLAADEIDDGKWLAIADIQLWLDQRPGEFAPTFATIWEICAEWLDSA